MSVLAAGSQPPPLAAEGSSWQSWRILLGKASQALRVWRRWQGTLPGTGSTEEEKVCTGPLSLRLQAQGPEEAENCLCIECSDEYSMCLSHHTGW